MSVRSHTLLAQRIARLASVVREAAALPEPNWLPALGMSRIVVTGLGSSAANARFLASLLAAELGLPASFVPTARLVARPPRGAEHDLLIVFSQGLSPNARAALRHVAAWGRVLLVTSLAEQGSGDDAAGRDRALHEARSAGVVCIPLAVEREFGMLARVLGPVAGYVAAFAIARTLGRSAGRDVSGVALDVEQIVARIEAAEEALADTFARDEALAPLLSRQIVMLCSGGIAEQLTHCATKVLEGMWLPQPPLLDLLEFAHGPYQALVGRDATLLYFARDGVAGEADAIDRLASMLEPERHALRILRARTPGPMAIFEYEAQLDHLMLRYARECDLDLAAWPGKDADGPLYSLDGARDAVPGAEPVGTAVASAAVDGASGARRLASQQLGELRWPEIEARLSAGATTAIVPLGSTEQHGPHLPFATDSWIAAALGRELCARLPEAVALPVLEFGCASEHMGFPGTLSLGAETLEAVLGDVLASLAHHGFARAFVFSAHGGNLEPLRAMRAALSQRAQPMRLVVAAEDGLARLWHEASAGFGVSPGASGQHAGEFETSIVAALAPGSVARAQLKAGTIAGGGEAQEIFYPDLRANAPDGVVGDPCAADAARAAAYLVRWSDALVEIYRADR